MRQKKNRFFHPNSTEYELYVDLILRENNRSMRLWKICMQDWTFNINFTALPSKVFDKV